MINTVCDPREHCPLESGAHKHLCDKCGACWKHHTADAQASTEAFNEAHSCPQCGTEQTYKYWTPDEEKEAAEKRRAFEAGIASDEDLRDLLKLIRKGFGR